MVTGMACLVLMNITMVILVRAILVLILLLLRYELFLFNFLICIWLILETTSHVMILFVIKI